MLYKTMRQLIAGDDAPISDDTYDGACMFGKGFADTRGCRGMNALSST